MSDTKLSTTFGRDFLRRMFATAAEWRLFLTFLLGGACICLFITVNTPNDELLKYRSLLNSAPTHSQPAGWRFPAIYVGDRKNPGIDTKWTSQVGQDKTVIDILNGKRDGFFVDLASNDAVELSNTLTLEQAYGWRGLCIEPNPQYFDGLLDRKCQVVVAVAGQTNNEDIRFNLRDVFSGVIKGGFDNARADEAKGTNFKTVTVEKVFEDFNVPRVIDYLSLDIEGAELWTFEKFPWDKYVFSVITVERPKGLADVLRANGYIYVRDQGWFGDQLWIHNSLPNRDEVLAKYGPGGTVVFDQQNVRVDN